MKPIRIRGIVLTCATCERETEATAIAWMDTAPFGGDVRYREVRFPRDPVTGAESGWAFDFRTQTALCPDHAPKEPA